MKKVDDAIIQKALEIRALMIQRSALNSEILEKMDALLKLGYTVSGDFYLVETPKLAKKLISLDEIVSRNIK